MKMKMIVLVLISSTALVALIALSLTQPDVWLRGRTPSELGTLGAGVASNAPGGGDPTGVANVQVASDGIPIKAEAAKK